MSAEDRQVEWASVGDTADKVPVPEEALELLNPKKKPEPQEEPLQVSEAAGSGAALVERVAEARPHDKRELGPSQVEQAKHTRKRCGGGSRLRGRLSSSRSRSQKPISKKARLLVASKTFKRLEETKALAKRAFVSAKAGAEEGEGRKRQAVADACPLYLLEKRRKERMGWRRRWWWRRRKVGKRMMRRPQCGGGARLGGQGQPPEAPGTWTEGRPGWWEEGLVDWLKVTDVRTGPRGKTQWLLWKGVRVIFDDNWNIVKETRRAGVDAYHIGRHSGSFWSLGDAVEHFLAKRKSHKLAGNKRAGGS